MKEYRVSMITTVSNPWSSSVVSPRLLMSYREIREHIATMVDCHNFTETIHGEGYGWDDAIQRHSHFRYVLTRNGETIRETHTLLIERA